MPSIEIPQSVKTVQLPAKTAASCHDPAVTIAEISDPTAVGQSIEVIEQDVVQLE